MHRSPHFDPLFDPLTISDREWLAMSEEEFLLRFGIHLSHAADCGASSKTCG